MSTDDDSTPIIITHPKRSFPDNQLLLFVVQHQEKIFSPDGTVRTDPW